MTTKTELQQKIAELQAQVDAMPDDKPESDVAYDSVAGKFYFKSTEGHKAWKRAEQTILHLHMLSDWREGDDMWVLLDSRYHIKPCDGSVIIDRIFGRFATEQSAQAAIDTVGKANIEYAVKVLTGGGYAD
jgi:hypothetical protein